MELRKKIQVNPRSLVLSLLQTRNKAPLSPAYEDFCVTTRFISLLTPGSCWIQSGLCVNVTTVTKPNPLECFEEAGETVSIFSQISLSEELFGHFLIKQTLRTEFQDQEITDPVQTSCSTHSKQSTECQSVCPGSPPRNDTAAWKHLSV